VTVVSMLREEYPSIELVMIGPDKGDYMQQITEQMVEKLALQEHVRIIGAVAKEDVASWLSEADIFLNTTTIDNTPLSLIEAMACGLCIVTTRVGGIPYLVEGGVEAMFVPVGHAAGMADAVRRVLVEAGLAARLSSAGREKAERFGWSAVLPMWAGVIGELTAQSEPKRS
jgi:glycosyltransferase involved in cell wall biosynthesis